MIRRHAYCSIDAAERRIAFPRPLAEAKK